MMMMTIGKDDKKQMFPKEVKVLSQIKYKIKLKIIPQKYILMTFHGLLILFTELLIKLISYAMQISPKNILLNIFEDALYLWAFCTQDLVLFCQCF